MAKVNFVHLHTHSCFSKRDAHSRIDKLVAKAKENGQTAIALTDHGVLHGIPQLFRECAKHEVKPIAGMEGYLSEGARQEAGETFHQLLIVKNETGWVNLMKLSSEAYLTGFYNRPRMDMELLRNHSEGLVATSSCLAGKIPQLIMAGSLKEAREVAKEFQDIFGPDFYLELQPNRTAEQDIVNKELVKIGAELGIELIITGDVHFVEASDVTAHQGMLCLARNGRMETETEPAYPDEEIYFLHHGKEIFQFMRSQGFATDLIVQAMNNTGKIADEIQFELKKKGDLLPAFPLPDGTDKDKLLGEMVKEGLLRKVARPTKEYIERVQFELKVIREKGYQDYFLIKADALKWCKEQGILVGFGRGSGAGSLVAYLMDITEIDPIKNGLIFERFLDITRQKMPDIDSDIQGDRRHELIAYLKNKYGHRRVAQVANYGTMSAKLAFKNALMVYDVPFGTAQEVSNLVPDELGITIEGAYELSPQLRAMRKQTVKRNDGKQLELSKVFDMAERFEGVVDKLGRHAGGILISPDDLDEHFPVFTVDGDVVAQWDKDDLEELGGVKFDFLGLKTLETVSIAVNSIQKETGEVIDIYDIVRKHNDPKTYKLIAEGRTDNVFQLSSDGMKKLCREVAPTTLEHITAINALYRPPALASGDTWRYARIKQGKEHEHYSHPDERAITGETYGVITYQEHVMKLVHWFAGWEYGRGDKLRKMKQEQLEELRSEFIEDACTEWGWGADSEFAGQMDEIWSRIVQYMGYGFNKSHGVAYSVLSYLTAYLEANYPAHWLSAIMSTKMGDQDKIAQVFAEIKNSKFDYRAPDINLSEKNFVARNNTIIFPMGAIKGVGDTAVEEILRVRSEGGDFTSLEDLMERVNLRVVSKRPMKPLILSGCFDSLYPELTRKDVLVKYLELKKDGKKNIEEARNMDWNDDIQAEHEKALVGVYVTTHPLAKYHFKPWGDFYNGERNCLIGGRITKVKTFLDKNKNRMAFVSLETLETVREVVVFASTFKKAEPLLKEGNMVMINGRKDDDKLLADKVRELL
jgi:DNA polymerase-3 subunit alpha